MNIAFISENGLVGKVPRTFENARVEFAWMLGLDATHYNIGDVEQVRNYKYVFVILPKIKTNVNAEGSEIGSKINDPRSSYHNSDFIKKLKNDNDYVFIMQEGPNWLFNDYSVIEQFKYYGCLSTCDGIFVHNDIDKKFYEGITYGSKKVHVMRSVMVEDSLKDIKNEKEDKTIIGGNFSRWYGGFQSFMVGRIFGNDIYAQTSHSKRSDEQYVGGLNHLPRLSWVDWMKEISTFKYAVHLMPTIAAGTFSLNCAYFGIPCIGNKDVDTQNILHPLLSVDINDIDEAVKLATKLKEDEDFYKLCSDTSKRIYKEKYIEKVWKKNMVRLLQDEY